MIGTCEPRFDRVRDVFAASFAGPLSGGPAQDASPAGDPAHGAGPADDPAHGASLADDASRGAGPADDLAESGASFAVWHQGRPVLDLVGGWRDPGRTRPWTPDTLVNVYSAGKPIAALCVLLLVERGRIGLDDPIVRHWAEFRSADTTVRHALSHTAGLPVFPVRRPAEAFADWPLLVADLAGAEPLWPAGTVAAEHALSYGHLLGELVRRVDGRSIGQFLADEIARPWRLDLHVGLGPADQARCAELGYGVPDWPVSARGAAGSLRARALGNPAGCLDLAVLNSPLWRGAEIPAVNLHATASGLARLYAALLGGGTLDGIRLFSAELVAELTRVQYAGTDLLLERPTRWTLGMQYEDDGSWGMSGIGGSTAYADPARNYTFAYATRQLAGFDRVEMLITALHACLDDPTGSGSSNPTVVE
ncbi:beta-lactamase family protein [Plantactinospora sp. S1510]|uniref:Beta-lactamase family protein n=1 Tax=Plantactinospora alkalitolerans TaxID=2789879 RepID=A0ABS0H6Q4_9ACTN|nr:serine hydrolase domain-containing protein [Plantactinospora alkalitolerans]MBF9134148.1 beta-lactamase family protein [Plantactinospora alkalitolerans]